LAMPTRRYQRSVRLGRMPAESTNTSREALCGSVQAILIAMRPPLECPTIAGRSIARASMKAATNTW
jgi:hypothetical protein